MICHFSLGIYFRIFRGKRKRSVITARKYSWRKGTGVSSVAIQSAVESQGESKSVSSSGFFEQNSEKDFDVGKCTQIKPCDQIFNFEICNTSFDSLL